tara:strand:- start:157 stop:534 length:378 start_codon:yes stop_codon:yes gene_type:complete
MDAYVRGEQKKRERNKENTGEEMPDTHAETSETSPKKESEWGDKMKKASDVLAKLAQNTPGSVHRGVDYNRNVAIREGLSKNPFAVTDEGYSGGIKTSEGPQTTLLRDIDVETGKKKKKNKNYDY